MEILKKEGIEGIVEFTPVDGPQYNGVVERAFQNLYSRVRAMLNHGGFFGYISARGYILIDCCNLKGKFLFKGLYIYFFGDLLFGMGVIATIQQILFFTIMPLMTYFFLQKLCFREPRQIWH